MSLEEKIHTFRTWFNKKSENIENVAGSMITSGKTLQGIVSAYLLNTSTLVFGGLFYLVGNIESNLIRKLSRFINEPSEQIKKGYNYLKTNYKHPIKTLKETIRFIIIPDYKINPKAIFVGAALFFLGMPITYPIVSLTHNYIPYL